MEDDRFTLCPLSTVMRNFMHGVSFLIAPFAERMNA